MSKFSNLLRMLILLKSRGRMKTSELSELLEVDERMIRKYKSDLEMAGIYIDSYSGKDGGLELNDIDYLINMNITPGEFMAIESAEKQLKDTGYIYLNNYKSLKEKIQLAYGNKSDAIPYIACERQWNKMSEDRKMSIDFNAAIILKNKIWIKYFSLSRGEVSERVIHPYYIINRNGALYFTAYCEKSRMIKDFKFSRVRDYKLLNVKFIMDDSFKIDEYMENVFGMFKGDTINLKMKVKKPMSYIVSETCWVDNQKITWLEDESIIFEAEMKGIEEIISWILSLGDKAEVLDPENLADEIKVKAKGIINQYNNE
jgi:predicted DNA-binding transcriptional regulator YafY